MAGKRRAPVRAIVYFDGACALCNRAVAWCLARGVPRGVRFAPQGGDRFARLVAVQPQLASVDSMVVHVIPAAGGVDVDAAAAPVGEVLVRSEAVLWLAARLRGPERWLELLPWLVPRAVLDRGYRLLASNRQWLGRRMQECPVPTPEQRRYFLT